MRLVAQTLRIVSRLLTGLALVVLFAFAAHAQEFTNKAHLDELFAELRTAKSPSEAHTIDQQIWMEWTSPSDPILAGRMNEVFAARSMGDPLSAIVLLDRLIIDYPTYAEGWNQRATMYYMVGNYDASIADCAKVLELEPRHFGALSGRAMMYLSMGKRAEALQDMRTALTIHPFLNERQLFPELEQEVTHI